MKNTNISHETKSIIKNNWKSKNRTASELIIYLALTKENYEEAIECSFSPNNKNKNAYNHCSLVNAAINTNIEKTLSEFLVNTDLNNNEKNKVKREIEYIITHLLLKHLGKMNLSSVYHNGRLQFMNKWKECVKYKNFRNKDFVIFILFNKSNIWEQFKKSFPKVQNENKKGYISYNKSTYYNGLFLTLSEMKSIPTSYSRIFNYNLKISIMRKILPSLAQILIYEEML